MSGKSDTVSDLMAQQQELTAKINTNRQTVDTLQKEIEALDAKIAADQESANEIARGVQVSDPARSMVNMILSSRSITDFIEQMVAINMVNESAHKQLAQLRETKTAKSTALEEQKAAQVKLDQDDQKLKESLAVATPQASFTPQNPAYASLGDVAEEDARANIVARESNGNYEAVNGIMYGAYQMANMAPGTPPAEQDAAAQAYVEGRYGSWAKAWEHWIANHWY
ncbi:coiled-coil domain-containing protein [Lactovum odontotermitis]